MLESICHSAGTAMICSAWCVYAEFAIRSFPQRAGILARASTMCAGLGVMCTTRRALIAGSSKFDQSSISPSAPYRSAQASRKHHGGIHMQADVRAMSAIKPLINATRRDLAGNMRLACLRFKIFGSATTPARGVRMPAWRTTHDVEHARFERECVTGARDLAHCGVCGVSDVGGIRAEEP